MLYFSTINVTKKNIFSSFLKVEITGYLVLKFPLQITEDFVKGFACVASHVVSEDIHFL